ncbi:MAG: sigma-70 family RNA polymerase sigma factor [Zavarzinella sp.]
MVTTSASLLDRVRTGSDPSAWSRFVELYTPILHHWCHRLRLTESDSADFIQDVFLILVYQLPRFRYDPKQSFRAWLKTILMNVWRNYERKRSRLPVAGENAELIADSDPGHLIDEAEHRAFLMKRALEIAQVNFEPTSWKACWEFVVRNRPAEEVAAELQITVNAVYLAKSRVLRHLRTELAGLLD